MNLDRFKNDDERGVSPVIGVILMVAITVILAAVIASFVLGLGGNNEPAPSPTIDSSEDSGTLTFDVTGGDDFEADDAELAISMTLEADDDGSGSADTVTEDATRSLDDSSNFISSGGSSSNLDVSVATSISSGDEVTAGDSISFEVSNSNGADYEITGWEVEIIWNPADQDSSVIYSDSAS